MLPPDAATTYGTPETVVMMNVVLMPEAFNGRQHIPPHDGAFRRNGRGLP
jgi:hypothetical protein